jgi:ABC-type glutathione transport system ATPase component
MKPSTTTSRAPHDALVRRFEQLMGKRREIEKRQADCRRDIDALAEWLSMESRVTSALDTLSQNLFERITALLQEKLTIALQEVLEQPISLKVDAKYLKNSTSIEFTLEREGKSEDIMRGTGGSVANILSVGLRIFALTTLDKQTHRRFLVLDEQDCWLHPDIVPRLVKIIREAGRALGFQVLMISHHDSAVFENYADRIIKLQPGPDGVAATVVYDRETEPGNSPD